MHSYRALFPPEFDLGALDQAFVKFDTRLHGVVSLGEFAVISDEAKLMQDARESLIVMAGVAGKIRFGDIVRVACDGYSNLANKVRSPSRVLLLFFSLDPFRSDIGSLADRFPRALPRLPRRGRLDPQVLALLTFNSSFSVLAHVHLLFLFF